MRERFHLIDRDSKKREKLLNAHEVAAKIAIKYGIGNTFSEAQIREFWRFKDDPPSYRYFERYVPASSIKKVLQTSFRIEDEIWNENFIHGMSRNCKIRRSKIYFPSLEWFNNQSIKDIVKISPFGGRTGANFKKKKYRTGDSDRDRWMFVPILELPCDEETTSYVAGVLAGGILEKRRGKTFVRYRYGAIEAIKKLNIPIEWESEYFIVISPIWPALFSIKMPPQIQKKWLAVKKPYGSDIYPPILWRTYVKRAFTSKGIPFLQSKRAVLYKHKCKEGATKRIENLRFELGLTDLDLRIRDAVQEWAKQNEKS